MAEPRPLTAHDAALINLVGVIVTDPVLDARHRQIVADCLRDIALVLPHVTRAGIAGRLAVVAGVLVEAGRDPGAPQVWNAWQMALFEARQVLAEFFRARAAAALVATGRVPEVAA